MPERCLYFFAFAACLIAGTAPKVENLGQIQLYFEPNLGQADPRVKFTARGGGLAMFLTPDETVLAPRGRRSSAVRMRFRGARSGSSMEGLERQPGVTNYYRGNDPKQWRTGVPHYARVIRRGVYEGVDVAYYANGKRLEYDFVVAPGADPGVIRLAYHGADGIRVDERGDLVLAIGEGELRQHKPLVYQAIAGRKVEIEAKYRLEGREAALELARYDASRELVIDPVLTYATVLGGSDFDSANGVAVDAQGAVYVVGKTSSTNFPLVAPADATLTDSDTFVSKLAPGGQFLEFSTYLGGRFHEEAMAVALSATGDVFVCGVTGSKDFPMANAFQASTTALQTGFAARFSAQGSLVYSTYVGGSGNDAAAAIAVDAAGNAYVAGSAESADFPGFASQGGDGFIVRISPSGSNRVFSYRMGGTALDSIAGIAIDGTGVYVTGSTSSPNFPVQSAFQPSYGGGVDAFAAKVRLDGTALIYSTYLGGTDRDEGAGIAVDAAGAAYVTGRTFSLAFPTRNAFYPSMGGVADAFVTKLHPAGSAIEYSTYLGGPESDAGAAITVSPGGAVSIAANCGSCPNYAAAQGYQPGGFAIRLTPSGSLGYSTSYGGAFATAIALDGAGNAVLAGTVSVQPPLVDGYDMRLDGYTDAFVARFSDGAPPVRVTIQSVPSGRRVEVDGQIHVTPASFVWQPTVVHSLNAISPQTDAGSTYVLQSWTQGGAANQTVVTPFADTTYTAVFSTAPCTYSASPSSINLGTDGSWQEVSITTALGCSWEVSSSATWINRPFGSNSGPMRVRIGAAVNIGGPRTAEIRAGPLSIPVNQSAGKATLPAPIGRPFAPGSRLPSFGWEPVPGATGYEVIVRIGFPYEPGPPNALHEYRSAEQPTSIVLHRPAGIFMAFIRACAGGFTDDHCGPFGGTPLNPGFTTYWTPTILYPTPGQTLRESTQEFRWGTGPGADYHRLTLLDATGKQEMQIRVPDGVTSTIYSMRGSPRYTLRLESCGPAMCSPPNEVAFNTALPPIPTVAPSITSATALSGNSYRFAWTPITGADIYRIAVIQPNTGPGGGALTVASTQTAVPEVTLTVPPGPATAIVAACTGRGCGPYSAGAPISPTGPAPAAPVFGQPISVTNVDGPLVFFAWSRIPGDNGFNTLYRLYAADLARGATALDVLTQNNFHAAQFSAEGHRYDAVVAVSQGSTQTVGPPVGFIVQGSSPPSPTPVSPTHGGIVRAGDIDIAWTPVADAWFYQWAIFRLGESRPALTGLNPGTAASVRLPAGAQYSLAVRACPSVAPYAGCERDSDSGWGPWSSAAGGGGVANFTVAP